MNLDRQRNLEVMASPGFDARCREVNARIETDDLTPEQIAAALGLDWEFFSACLAVHVTALTGVPAYVVPDNSRKH
jgi:hypothetical protein